MATQKRVNWVDYAKGVGIFLVVLGHTIRGLVASSILQPSGVVQFVDQWIYAFHMPLFFFLSGLFIHRSASKPFRSFLIEKLQVIVYPYFVWSLLQELLRIGLEPVDGSTAEALLNLWRILYVPPMQFWFLYVLFILLLLYAGARRLQVTAWGFLGFAVLLYGAHLVGLSFGSWGVLYQLRMNAIYFAVGAVVGTSTLLPRFDKVTSRQKLLLLSLGGYAAIAGAVALGLATIKIWIPILALIGIAASLGLAKLIEQFQFASIRQWGVLSLQIYVVHTIASAALRVLLQKGFHVTDPALHLVAGTAIGIYAPIALQRACQRFNFPQLFTLRFPVSIAASRQSD